MSAPVQSVDEVAVEGSSLPGDPLTIETQKAGDKRQSRLSCCNCGVSFQIVSRVVGVVLFIFVLSTLVMSKLSFLIMTQQFNDTTLPSVDESIESLKTRKAAEFWRLLIALIIPSLFSFLRCIRCGLISRTLRNYPWPNKLANLAVSLNVICTLFVSDTSACT